MTTLRIGNVQRGLMLAVALAVSWWPAAGRAYTPEQQQACTGDAFRLCSSDIPDVDRVTACMIRNKSQLSAPCRAHFRPGPEPREAAAAPAGEPLAIRPAARKPAGAVKTSAKTSPKTGAKARKPKKPAKPART